MRRRNIESRAPLSRGWPFSVVTGVAILMVLGRGARDGRLAKDREYNVNEAETSGRPRVSTELPSSGGRKREPRQSGIN